MSLIENNEELWQQSVKIEALSTEEQQKFNEKNRKLMTDPNKKMKYTKKSPSLPTALEARTYI